MNKIMRMICVVMLLVLTGSASVYAATEKKGTINYAVRVVLPKNQINIKASSFDLMVEPGQQQVLQAIIINEGDEEIKVALEANTAISNANGLIEFVHTLERDPSMVVDFASIVTPVEPVVVIPAHGETIAEFLVTVPEEPFEGVVYGGFMFTKLHQGEDAEEEGGMAIRNIYRYAIGARLRESQSVIEPAFELTGVEMDPSGKPVMLLYLRNPQPVIARDIVLSATIYPMDENEPVAAFEKNIAMAPNTVMNYRIRMDDPNILKPDMYRVSVTLEFEDRFWQFETMLTVR